MVEPYSPRGEVSQAPPLLDDWTFASLRGLFLGGALVLRMHSLLPMETVVEAFEGAKLDLQRRLNRLGRVQTLSDNFSGDLSSDGAVQALLLEETSLDELLNSAEAFVQVARAMWRSPDQCGVFPTFGHPQRRLQ